MKVVTSVYGVVAMLRLAAGALIFLAPLPAVLASTFLDLIDAEFASMSGFTQSEYERADKTLDIYWYTSALAYIYLTLAPFFPVFLLLYIWRVAGYLFYLRSDNRKMLLLFPNFFENVFLLVFFATAIPVLNFLLSGPYLYVSLGCAVLLKILQEWYIHGANLSVRESLFRIKRRWRSPPVQNT